MAPYVRPFLAVAQTTLHGPDGTRYPFMGLFTTVDLPKGSFLGFYSGEFKEGEYRGKDSYVFQLSDVYIKPRKTRRGVDAARYPLAMCNEPRPGETASVAVVEFSTARDVITSLPPSTKIAALGFFTCRDVRGGEELSVHYGTRYHRGHYANPDDVDPLRLVGKPGRLLKAERQTPRHMAAAFGHFYVDRECYIEYEP